MTPLPEIIAAADDVGGDRLMPVGEVVRLLGCSAATFKRLGPNGPPIIRISDRICGVKVSDFKTWVASRRTISKQAAGDVEASGPLDTSNLGFGDHG